MANMFISWKNLQPKTGTASITGGDRIPQGVQPNRFAIFSLNWGASRDVSMAIGDGNNCDSGMASMEEVTFYRELDGASEYLLSRMYVPGYTGDTLNITMTKPDRGGGGLMTYLQIQLQGARIVEYSINAIDGETPIESLAVVYNKIFVQHWNEDRGGMLEKGGEVGYDLATAKSPSHSKLAAGG